MPFLLMRGDITKVACDAIVNAANNTLLGGGGVDGAIHAAAGPELLAECRTLGGCATGQAKLTRAYRLPAKYVIHTVGPIWQGGTANEPALLEACYRNSLKLAVESGCESVAFPLISAGAYCYPKEQALAIAAETIRAFLAAQEEELTVYLVVFDRASFRLSQSLSQEIRTFIDDRYAEAHANLRRSAMEPYLSQAAMPAHAAPAAMPMSAPKPAAGASPAKPAKAEKKRLFSARREEAKEDVLWDSGTGELGQYLSRLDESFSQMLLRKIDEAGISDASCYKKANVDRKLFSKIRGDIHYRPSKPTALAFAIALELPLGETNELLQKAGYALSHSSKFDLIIEFFIRRGDYDVLRINEALFAYDQPLLGC